MGVGVAGAGTAGGAVGVGGATGTSVTGAGIAGGDVVVGGARGALVDSSCSQRGGGMPA